ncbi:phosphate signaling complex protein PhoU [Sanguibacter suaedae]|uniref:Phosphate-specific transport system accessory protein PhoU n=1 Tax=Sanguibacter suaedae TaxID=2795737 RepID=A0A934I5A6_9MICO|nr:phosphate signaling complex protein PhoU [Sanguibacter suaedae]MBI9114511.1 phosphate signaling complex protein PhoU [Sanguibacter suaedae]
MREIFEAELQQIGDDLAEMSRLVESAISRAGTALLTADLQLAQSVIAADHAIDQLERELDERCVLLLAQQQPVATDLRVVVSALRMSSTLERMGDLARHIAQVARGRYPHRAIAPAAEATFAGMHEAATGVAQRTTTLLTTRDLAVASTIEREDDTLDLLHQDTFAALLNETWDGTAQQTIDVTLVARYYERFGDHGVSIARRVVYLVTGDFAEERGVTTP